MIYFHPQRGAVVTDEPLNEMWLRYRGGKDSDWRVVSEPLPKGFLRGDPSRQIFGMGGGEEVFGPLEMRCRDCAREFIFTAAEQKRWLETYGFYIDSRAVRCRPCRSKRRRIEERRREYAHALKAAAESPSANAHLEAARAALELIRAGGRAPMDKAVAHARRARRLGAERAAERLLDALKKVI